MQHRRLVSKARSATGCRGGTGKCQSVEYQHLQDTWQPFGRVTRDLIVNAPVPGFDRATYATETMVDSTAAVQIAMAAALSTTVRVRGFNV